MILEKMIRLKPLELHLHHLAILTIINYIFNLKEILIIHFLFFQDLELRQFKINY